MIIFFYITTITSLFLRTQDFIRPIFNNNAKILNGMYAIIGSDIIFNKYLSDFRTVNKSFALIVFLIDFEDEDSFELKFQATVDIESENEPLKLDKIKKIYAKLNIKKVKYFILNIQHIALTYLLGDKSKMTVTTKNSVKDILDDIDKKIDKCINKLIAKKKKNNKNLGENEKNEEKFCLDLDYKDFSTETVKRIIIQNKLVHISNLIVTYDEVNIDLYGVDEFIKGGTTLNGMTKILLRKDFMFDLNKAGIDTLINTKVRFNLFIELWAHLKINENNQIDLIKNKVISFFKSSGDETTNFAIYGERNPSSLFRNTFNDVWKMVEQYEKQTSSNEQMDKVN